MWRRRLLRHQLQSDICSNPVKANEYCAASNTSTTAERSIKRREGQLYRRNTKTTPNTSIRPGDKLIARYLYESNAHGRRKMPGNHPALAGGARGIRTRYIPSRGLFARSTHAMMQGNQ
jgi:hypothetical protein